MPLGPGDGDGDGDGDGGAWLRQGHAVRLSLMSLLSGVYLHERKREKEKERKKERPVVMY